MLVARLHRKKKTPSWRPRPDAAQVCFQSRAKPKRQIVGATTITAWCKQGPKRQDWLAAALGDDSRSRWGLRGVRSQKRPEAGQGAFTVSRLAVWPCARRACGPPASWWIVCQPRTLTVPVPRNPLSGPPGFRGGTGGPRRGPGRGRI